MPKKKDTSKRRSAEAFYVDPPAVRRQVERLEAAFEAGTLDADELVARLRALSMSYVDPNLPPEPTDALPGTPEKEAVMTERFTAGYAVFHPDDAIGPRAEKKGKAANERQKKNDDPPRSHSDRPEAPGPCVDG